MNYNRAQVSGAIRNNRLPFPIAATKTGLLVAAASFGSIFAYNTLSPISVVLAVIVAAAVIGLNFAESYLVQYAVAAWRFGFKKMALISAAGALVIAGYSIMAGSNVIESYLKQNQNSSLASDYDIAASKQRIQAAKSAALNSLDFGNAQSDYMEAAAAENEKIAALLRSKPVTSSSVDPSTMATIVAVAIELGVILLTAFIETFIKPTPLPALIRFNDKLVDWGLNDDQLKNLTISASPSLGTVALPEESENRPERERSRAGGLEVVPADAFEEWLYAVRTEEIKPTLNASKSYLRSVHAYKIEYAQEKAVEYLEQAFNQGFLALNDQGGVAQSKYVLAGKANQNLLGVG